MIINPEIAEAGRAQARRAQILDAATKRFGDEGFHGASMADIASEAGMSVGHIYRYFENKEAIIAAIVERDMAEAAQRSAEVRAHTDDLIEELMAVARFKIERLAVPGRAALALEIMAEAARNPRVAEIVRAADETGRARLRDALTRSGPPVDEECLVSRMDMIVMLLDGWIMRAVKNPGIDTTAYIEAMRAMFRVLLSENPNARCG